MTEIKLTQLIAWFDNKITDSAEQQKLLLADNREDEAVFENVKANIYDIFRTILNAAAKAGRDNQEEIERFFFLKTAQIPANWEASYEKAKQHGDTEKMLIERIKLDTIQEIRTKFIEILGEAV